MSKISSYALKKRLRYFTLLELMIALAIIGSVAGIIGINANKAMRQQRFRTEASSIVQQLRLAQNLMLILNQDVKIAFRKNNKSGNLEHAMTFQCPLDSPWEKELLRTHAPLKEIIQISFTYRDSGAAKTSAKDFELKFLSGGAVMSEGIVELLSRGGEKRYIHLLGAPHPIQATETDTKETLAWRGRQHHLQEMAMDIVKEIHAKRPLKAGKQPNNAATGSNAKPLY